MTEHDRTHLDAFDLARLRYMHCTLEAWISRTPTSALRVKLTECNILTLIALDEGRYMSTAEVESK